jgi:hypothetical protein
MKMVDSMDSLKVEMMAEMTDGSLVVMWDLQMVDLMVDSMVAY